MIEIIIMFILFLMMILIDGIYEELKRFNNNAEDIMHSKISVTIEEDE